MEKYKIQNIHLQTKCAWTPFDGMEVVGKVTRVILYGKTVFENGKVLAKAGSGKYISPKI